MVWCVASTTYTREHKNVTIRYISEAGKSKKSASKKKIGAVNICILGLNGSHYTLCQRRVIDDLLLSNFFAII